MRDARESTPLSASATGFKSGFVSIVGKPNTGKSTLLNALVGTKLAAVTPKPQTTRTRIQGVLTRAQAQIVFLDTPGIHRPDSRLNAQMMTAVEEALTGIDLVLLVADVSKPRGEEDRLAVEVVKRSGVQAFLLLNKIDLVAKPRLLPLIEVYRKEHDFHEFIPISALHGDNLDLLERKIIDYLPLGPPCFPEDYLTDQPEYFLAAEIIREKVFLETRQEVPYATAVVVEKFEESGRLLCLHATILVEREGQKGILIGTQGERLKRIGQRAREELEFLLARKLYLELFVKTQADWRAHPGLARLIDWRVR